MARNQLSNQHNSNTSGKTRPVEKYLAFYTERHQNKTNTIIHWVCIPVLLFAVFGLLWAIPFPHLRFLGAYNGYINWASFLIAICIYYYYKLSPMLSYLMLLVLMSFSFGITELANWQKAGGVPLMLVCSILFVLSCAGLLMGYKIEGKKASFSDLLKFMLIGPLWLLHLILKKISLRY